MNWQVTAPWVTAALVAAAACGDEDHTFEDMGGRARNPGDVGVTMATPEQGGSSSPSGGTGGSDTGPVPGIGGQSVPVDVPVQIGGSPGFAGFPPEAGTSGFGTPGITGGAAGLGGSSFSGSGGGGNVPGGLLDAGVGI